MNISLCCRSSIILTLHSLKNKYSVGPDVKLLNVKMCGLYDCHCLLGILTYLESVPFS
jgi:hypothetical protein